MRVISGVYKGFSFDPGKKFHMRPTTDRNREALFNILSHRLDLEGMDILDVFAGAGGISYEFASRGAGSVVCIEKNTGLCQFINQQFEKLGFEHYEVVCSDAYRFLKNSPPENYDLIFADPPYNDPGIPLLPAIVFTHHLLRRGGTLIIEHGINQTFQWGNPTEQRQYGQSVFSFFTETQSLCLE